MQLSTMQKTKLRKYCFCWLMILPAVIAFCVWYVYVNFNSILMAFQVTENGVTRFGFDNFGIFFREFASTDSVFASALKNTLKYFLASNLISFPLSIFLCYFIYKKILGYSLFRAVYYLPAIILGTVTSSVFKYIVAVDGPVDLVLQAMNIEFNVSSLLADSRFATNTMIFYGMFFGLGGSIIVLSGSMNSVSLEVLESAKLDGCGWLRELVQIILPMMWPTIQTILITASVGMFTSSGPILLFTQGKYDTYTISYWLYEQVLNGTNFEQASAVGLVFTCIATPLVLLWKRFLFSLDEKIGV